MRQRDRNERRYTSAKARAEKQSTGFTSTYLQLPDGVKFFKPKPGTMVIDILPYVAGTGNPWAEKGNLHWERSFWVHRGVGINSDMFICPKNTEKKPCPICEHRMALMKEDGENEELVKDLAPRQRQLFNVINRKDPEAGVMLWEVSYHLFGKALDARLRNSDEDDNWDQFFFLEGGMSLKIGFAEKSFGGFNFLEAETIDFKPRTDYDEDILEKVHCLDDLLVLPEYKDLKKTFLQVVEAEKDDDDAGDRRKPSREDEDDAPPSKRKPAQEDDDGFDDDAPPAKKKPARDDDGFDDDAPAPKKKPSRDEDPDDGFDDEPAPKKKPAREEDPDEDAPAPKKRNRFDDDERPRVRTADEELDPDDEPAPKKKPARDEDEDDAPPAKKKPKKDDDWDDFDADDAPAPKKKPARDEDEDAPAPKKKPSREEDWDDDAPPAKKPRR